MWQSIRPGRRARPWPSITREPRGILTRLSGPTATIRSSSTTTVARSSLAPVPSISSTRRIASGMGLDSERGLDLADVAVHFHLAEDRLELAGFVDDECAALDAPVGLPVHVLLLVDPVGLRNLAVLIAQQREGEAVFLDELLMGLGVVHADAQYDGVSLLDRAQGVPKAARFLGAPRRVVLGVEVEHHLFAFEALQADRLAVLVGQGEVGGFVAYLQLIGHSTLLNKAASYLPDAAVCQEVAGAGN